MVNTLYCFTKFSKFQISRFKNEDLITNVHNTIMVCLDRARISAVIEQLRAIEVSK